MPKPVRLTDFRYCFGMIASVSTLERSNGTSLLLNVLNGFIVQITIKVVSVLYPDKPRELVPLRCCALFMPTTKR